jgi:hypothetical protein
MLSLEQELSTLLTPRTNPPSINVTTGTGIDKFVHALNATGLHSSFDIRVNRQWCTQLSTEMLKLSGDPTMQHFIHSVRMFADYDENDFALMGKEIAPQLMNDTDKAFMSLDRDAITSYLDLFFDKKGPMFLIDVLNQTIADVYNKYKDEPVNYVLKDYNNRKRIGVWLQLPVSNTETVNRLENEILKDYFKEKGFGLLVVHAEELREAGFDGKSDLNKFINSHFDVLDNEEFYPNGIVAIHPNWGYAARSMTESRLDIALNLRNSVNTQDDDRVMSNGKTLDGKKKLLGLKIEAGFRRQTVDWSYRQSEYLRQLFTEQCQETPGTPVVGAWLKGVNIFQRIAGAVPMLVQEQEIANELSDSDKIFRSTFERMDLENPFWKTNIDLLSKLKINTGQAKTKKLIEKIKKRISKPTAPKTKKDKTEEKDMRLFYIQILEMLIGYPCFRLNGYAASKGFTTIQETLEEISKDPVLAESLKKTLGISANEFILLLNEDGLPVDVMNYLFNVMVSEQKNEL